MRVTEYIMCVCMQRKKELLYIILAKQIRNCPSNIYRVKYKRKIRFIHIYIFHFKFREAFNSSGKMIANCITRTYCAICRTIVCPIRILLRVPVYFTTFSITAGYFTISLFLKSTSAGFACRIWISRETFAY